MFRSDYRNSVDMIVKELDFSGADDLANLEGGTDSVAAVRDWLNSFVDQVDVGTLSQSNARTSNITTLTEAVGGDLVRALSNPSEEQLEILISRKGDLSWRMKAVLCNFHDNKDIKLWFGQSNLAVVNFMHKYILDNYEDVYSKARVILAWNKLSKEKQKAITYLATNSQATSTEIEDVCTIS